MEILNTKKSVLLTERDYFILKGLYDYVVMSFPQITSQYFKDKSKPTIINRLSKLESAGFVNKYKIPRLISGKDKNVISVVYQISRTGIRELEKRFSKIKFYPEPIKLQPYSIDHDLLLVDVVLTLKENQPELQMMMGEHFYKTKMPNTPKPDALIYGLLGTKPVALELELTAKSEKRYRELILKYRLSKEFDSILYVTESDVIQTKIQNLVGPISSQNYFKFTSLEDILQNNKNHSDLQIVAESEVKIC
ncbi:MAG: replication-relaxation family protein [Bdellovibrionaceae bacterium]|nr:replication-relaxation family protein [Pseudobdellovibrionaceae bacterium]